MNVKVADFAEALQAEAEQLSLMSASPTSTTTSGHQEEGADQSCCPTV